MNIFILDNNITKCAEYHCDKHVVKMILETAQLLCTAVREKYEQRGLYTDDIPYKSTHLNHPSTIWVRESFSNFNWLLRLGFALCNQFEVRYTGKEHKTKNVLRWLVRNLATIKELYPEKGLTEFAQAMHDEYKNKDAVQEYRDYYTNAKVKIAEWNKGVEKPYWFN